MFEGANPERLFQEYEQLKKLVESTHPHLMIKFRAFEPNSKEPLKHDSLGQKAQMIKAVEQIIKNSQDQASVAALKAWISVPEPGPKTPEPVVDSVFSAMRPLSLTQRLPLLDLLRIAVMWDLKACLQLLKPRFSDFQDLLVSPSCEALSKTPADKKTVFLYTYVLKVLGNCLIHPEAAKLVADTGDLFAMFMFLLTTSLDMSDNSILYAATALAYNMVQSPELNKLIEDKQGLLEGIARAANAPGTDDVSLYWLGTLAARLLYLQDKKMRVAVKPAMDPVAAKMCAAKSENVRRIGEDLKELLC